MARSLGNEEVVRYQKLVRVVVDRLLLNRRWVHLTEKEDLYQIGWMTLMGCFDRFDKSRNVKFETFASSSIFNAVIDELRLLNRKQLPITFVNPDIPVDEVTETRDVLVTKLINMIELSGHFTTKERRIFWLRFTESQRFIDIGSKLDISKETARRIYNASIIKAKELMANE